MKRGDRDDVRIKLEEAKARLAVLDHVLRNGGDATGADLVLDASTREGLLYTVDDVCTEIAAARGAEK